MRNIIKGVFATILLCIIGVVLGWYAGGQIRGSPGEAPLATAMFGSAVSLLLSVGASVYFFGWQSVLGAYVVCHLFFVFLPQLNDIMRAYWP